MKCIYVSPQRDSNHYLCTTIYDSANGNINLGTYYISEVPLTDGDRVVFYIDEDGYMNNMYVVDKFVVEGNLTAKLFAAKLDHVRLR